MSTSRKRTRVDRACQSCITSKVRCQELLSTGCLRCRERGSGCSLAVPETTTTTPIYNEVTNSQNPADDPQTIIRDLTSRVQALEHFISSQTHSHLQSGLHKSSADQAVSTRYETLRSIGRNKYDSPTAFGGEHVPDLLEGYLTTATQDGYPDLVKEGFMTLDQVEMAFQLFKYRISALLPLHPYTQSASPTPTHPFLTLSILPFTPSISPSTPILNHLIDRALIHASCGASSVQAVESLLILSFAPLPKPEPGSLARCHLSSAELIALAYNMGQGIGLEMRSQASLKDSSYWEESWYITRVQETLMWEVVKSRYAMLHTQLTRSSPSTFPSSLLNLLPKIPTSPMSNTIDYLQLELELQHIVRPLLELLAEIDAEAVDCVPKRLRLIPTTWKEAHEGLTAWRTKVGSKISRLLDLEIIALEFILIIRIITVHQYLPSPLNPSIRLQGVATVYPSLMEHFTQIIPLILQLSDSHVLETVPSYIPLIMTRAVLAAKKTYEFRHVNDNIRNTDADTRSQASASDLGFSEADVFLAENRLRELGYVAVNVEAGGEQSAAGHSERLDGPEEQVVGNRNTTVIDMGLGAGFDFGIEGINHDVWEGFWNTFLPEEVVPDLDIR